MPTPVEKAPEPELGAELIPKERYTSPEFMQLEMDRMWSRVWLMGPRLQDLQKLGDYAVDSFGGESFIFVRSAEDRVQGFYNVCPHRGNQLRTAGKGRVKTFRCAYHFFEFKLDGSIHSVPDDEDFPQGLPRDKICMRSVRTDTWGGWVWFSMEPNGPPLREYLGMIPEHLDPYHFEDQYLVNDKTIEWDCNWKTSVDAFNEVYHVQAIHPQLLGMLDDVNVQIDLYERHNRYLVPFGVLSPRYPDQDEVAQPLKEMMVMAGIDPDTFRGKAADVRPALIEAGRKRAQQMGLDASELNDDQMVDDYHYMIFPNVTLNVHALGFMLFRQRPHPTDPNKMYFDLQNYVRVPPETAPERPDHTHHRHGEISLGLVLDQDAFNLPRVQRGMNSRGFEGLWIRHQERRIRHMHRTLDAYLAETG
jgi:phenylpropionate dioxygenase-like ring-hydroxylating dioxygenase large terminal subunit